MKFGAHVSTAGNFSLAIDRAVEQGCDCIQIFSNPPQRWNPLVIPEAELKLFKEKKEKAGIDPVVIHSIYLINLASDNSFFYEQSIKSLIDDMKKAQAIGALGVNTHLGSTKGRDFKDILTKVVLAIKDILAAVPASPATPGEDASRGLAGKDGPYFIIENSAGAGNIIGDKFAEIGAIIKAVNSNRVKVCLDTAHSFESGYDLKSEQGLEDTLNEFDKEIGLDKLVCLHLNDSKTPLGSNRDLHADIGQGEIGLEAFRRIVNHSKLKHLPGILETPNFKGKSDIDDLKILRDLVIK